MKFRSPVTHGNRLFGMCVLLLCAPISGLSETASSEVPVHSNAIERDHVAREFADSKLSMWQRRLHLEEWNISVVMTRRSDLKPKTRGKIRWDKGRKCAVISVLDAADYELPLQEMLDDMEFTIVHELIHLELASLPRSEASRSSEEHAVNRIAAALLGLARQPR